MLGEQELKEIRQAIKGMEIDWEELVDYTTSINDLVQKLNKAIEALNQLLKEHGYGH